MPLNWRDDPLPAVYGLHIEIPAGGISVRGFSVGEESWPNLSSNVHQPTRDSTEFRSEITWLPMHTVNGTDQQSSLNTSYK